MTPITLTKDYLTQERNHLKRSIRKDAKAQGIERIVFDGWNLVWNDYGLLMQVCYYADGLWQVSNSAIA